MDYEEAYKEAKLRMSAAYNSNRCTIGFMNEIFPQLEESEDEKVRKEIISALKWANDKDGVYDKHISWLEKQGKQVDCLQDLQVPNGGIVLEDFNGGEGHYKVNLDFLNKKQVEEIEKIVNDWNKDTEIKNCIGMILTDASEQRFKDYNTSLKECLDWLEKKETN